MNIVELNPDGRETLHNYIAGAISLTVFVAWLAIATQVESKFFPRGSPIWRRAGWPVFYAWDWCGFLYITGGLVGSGRRRDV